MAAGRLQVLNAPEFYHSTVIPSFTEDATPGIWDLWPINNLLRPHPLQESDRLTRPVQVSARTTGIALISLLQDNTGRSDGLWIEMFLSQAEPAHHGRTLCEDWAHIISSAKDDQSQAVILGLELKHLTPKDIAGFKSYKKLITSDMTLDLRKRT